jgi:hypothetical protein
VDCEGPVSGTVMKHEEECHMAASNLPSLPGGEESEERVASAIRRISPGCAHRQDVPSLADETIQPLLRATNPCPEFKELSLFEHRALEMGFKS